MVRKSTKRALKARGGFSSPPKWGVRRSIRGPRSGKPTWGRVINDTMTRMVKNSPEPSEEFLRQVGKVAKTRVLKTIEGTEYEKIVGPDGDETSPGLETQGCVSHLAVRSRGNKSSSAMGKYTRLSVKTGQAPSRAVKESNQENGSTMITDFNSRSMWQTDPQRSNLMFKYGFNEKAVIFPVATCYWTLANMSTVYSISSYNASQRSQRCYANSEFFGTKYTFHNSNLYARQKLKIHLVAVTSKDDNADSMLRDAFLNQLQGTQQIGKIPINQQYNDWDENSGVGYFGLVDPKARLSMSPSFMSRAQISKTYKKILQPGETFEFDHKHFTGSGVRIDRLAAMKADSASFSQFTPMYYYYIIEAEGMTVECVKTDDNDTRYTGTCSGRIHMEVERYYKQGIASENLIYNVDTEGGFLANDFGFRIFTDKTPAQHPVITTFHVPIDKIVDDPQAVTTDTWCIPYTTDQFNIFAGQNP